MSKKRKVMPLVSIKGTVSTNTVGRAMKLSQREGRMCKTLFLLGVHPTFLAKLFPITPRYARYIGMDGIRSPYFGVPPLPLSSEVYTFLQEKAEGLDDDAKRELATILPLLSQEVLDKNVATLQRARESEADREVREVEKNVQKAVDFNKKALDVLGL